MIIFHFQLLLTYKLNPFTHFTLEIIKINTVIINYRQSTKSQAIQKYVVYYENRAFQVCGHGLKKRQFTYAYRTNEEHMWCLAMPSNVFCSHSKINYSYNFAFRFFSILERLCKLWFDVIWKRSDLKMYFPKLKWNDV